MHRPDITDHQPTRTRETEAAYARRLRQLSSRIARRIGVDTNAVTAADIERELVSWAQDLSAATLRQYRAAVAYGVEAGRIRDGRHAPDGSAAPRGLRRGRKTSSLKIKRLTTGDLRRIDSALRRSSSGYARELRAFMLANALVGARVSEWRDARFVERHPETGEPALTLANAKHTNNRAHGRERTLHLGGMSREAVMTIDTCARWLNARHREGRFEKWQVGAAKLMQRVCRRLWPRRRRHVTLYSTRHRAASRFKALYGQAEVAALMGHGAQTTAGTHYARTARGRMRPSPATLPKPDADDVLRVRRRTREPLRTRRPIGGEAIPGQAGPP